MRRRNRAPWIAAVLLPAAIVGVLLLAWEIYARKGGVDDFILPAPSEILRALSDDRDLLWDNFWVTAAEVGLGILVALVAGALLAIAIHLIPVLRRALYPLLVGSQAVPPVIIAPLLILWWGFGMAPKLAIIALVCFFPVVVTTLDALAAVYRTSARCCARWTPRAGRSSAGWRRPRPFRARSAERRSPSRSP